MSLDTKEPKKVPALQTGIHLVNISKFGFITKTIGGVPQIVERELPGGIKEKLCSIVFTDNNGNSFDNTYFLGGDKQKYFEDVLHTIGVNPKGKIVAKEILRQRLYVCIKEIVDIEDDTIVTDIEGNEVKNFYIFKLYPFIDGGSKPSIIGNPEYNNGIPSGVFRTFRNVASFITSETKIEKEEIKMIIPETKKEEAPNFDIPEEPKVIEVKKPVLSNNINDSWDKEVQFDEPSF